MFAPAAELLAVTDKLEPPEAIVIAPKDTMVDAVVEVPVMEIFLADNAPGRETAVLAKELLLMLIDPLLAVRVPLTVPLTPALLVAVVLVDVAVKLMLPVVEVNAEVT